MNCSVKASANSSCSSLYMKEKTAAGISVESDSGSCFALIWILTVMSAYEGKHHQIMAQGADQYKNMKQLMLGKGVAEADLQRIDHAA